MADRVDDKMRQEGEVLAPLWASLEAHARTLGYDEDAFARACFARFLVLLRDRGRMDLCQEMMRLVADVIIPDDWAFDMVGNERKQRDA